MKVGDLDILLGADPELFIVDAAGNPVPAHLYIPGTKHQPHKVKQGAVQVDGIAAEFNIDPAACEDEFVDNIATVIDQLKRFIPADHKLLSQPTMQFTQEFREALPPEALELGCEPDFNAYVQAVNPRPNADKNFRTGAGHIHVGWCKDMNPTDLGHFRACCNLSIELDAALGIPSMLWDRDDMRRKLYGNPGCFRPKSYGGEYRTLSNAWVGNEPLTRAIYQQIMDAMLRLQTGYTLDKKLDAVGYNADSMIRRCKREQANRVLNMFKEYRNFANV